MTFGLVDVSVRFGDVQALSAVSVDARRGDITAVVGGDGSGKSTALRVLAGIVHPDSGHVHRPPKDRVGYLPALGGSWRNLSVDENVQFVGGAFGLAGRALAERAEPLLQRAGLDGARDRLAGRLSGGMRTKLGFCLATLHQPDLLILDEPTTGVDPSSRVDLWSLMSRAAADGAAVLMSTSYMDDAERAASLALLDRGSVANAGTPDQLIASMPGAVVECDRPTDERFAWRVGEGFREWFPNGAPDGRTPRRPDLDDVSIVTALGRREAATR